MFTCDLDHAYSSIGYHIYNIRNTTHFETSVFKKKVDSYLQTYKPCVPNEDNSLDSRVIEMRWCTLRGRLDGQKDQLKFM